MHLYLSHFTISISIVISLITALILHKTVLSVFKALSLFCLFYFEGTGIPASLGGIVDV